MSNKEFDYKIEDCLLPKNSSFKIAIYTPEQDIPIEVKNRLTIDESEAFIDWVVSGIFSDGNVNYLAKRLMVGLATIHYYTDLQMPNDIDLQYQIVSSTNIVQQIAGHNNFNVMQYDSILAAIDDQIQFESQRCLVDLRKESQEILDAFSGVEGIFKGISPDQVQNMISSISGGFDEKKLVDAIINKQKADTKQKKPRKTSSGKNSKVIEMKPDDSV